MACKYSGSGIDLCPLPRTGIGSSHPLTLALTIFFVTLGAVSVLIVILAGLKYVMSQGDPAQTAKAKDTIMYAVIGLAVCILAEGIIKVVLEKLL